MLFAVGAISLCANMAVAQKASPAANTPIGTHDTEVQGGGDPFARYLFPVELIMQHQGDIGLTDAQRTTITSAIQQAQGKFVETQFKLSGEGEKFGRLLQNTSVDETQVLEQLDRILSFERDMKHAQVGLLIRLKNALTPAQQQKLAQFR
jgi:Spy/CpxP family protein refolding chaperone